MAAPDFTSARWRKSTYSNEANACVEVASATSWRKSTCSQGENACVEVASTPDVAGVRDSKQHGSGPILAFDRGLWNRFIGKLKSGSFDQP
ncbi:DUF397 domain-containing protein [Saccharopolyspora hattusasensis]|uniref:DUF397 domain-containing protein n=1 Tax=Saccharopolyspora hattusasensis TaxID=1128679 RepID=UPI003D961423